MHAARRKTNSSLRLVPKLQTCYSSTDSIIELRLWKLHEPELEINLLSLRTLFSLCSANSDTDLWLWTCECGHSRLSNISPSCTYLLTSNAGGTWNSRRFLCLISTLPFTERECCWYAKTGATRGNEGSFYFEYPFLDLMNMVLMHNIFIEEHVGRWARYLLAVSGASTFDRFHATSNGGELKGAHR